MSVVCFYFQVHQPRRLRNYTFFDIGRLHTYEDVDANRLLLKRVSEKCYLPANRILLRQIRRHGGAFRVAFSLTGVLLEQLEEDQPDVLESFRELADTGCVEFLCETYWHSLAFLFSHEEFKRQLKHHKQKTEALFGRTPTTFRNTELIYNNELARLIEGLGFQVILTEGAGRILDGRSPGCIYRPQGCQDLRLLLRNYNLSDDVSFRFSDRRWSQYPLTAEKYAAWINDLGEKHPVVNIFLDYETFGEHQWEQTGIFEFLDEMPTEILKYPRLSFQTPAEAASSHETSGSLNVPEALSWADQERDLTAWLGNAMQQDALRALYALEESVCRSTGNLRTWRLLQTADHFYYMSTKTSADGDVHRYFNPYASPYDAYISYMNILDDFAGMVQ